MSYKAKFEGWDKLTLADLLVAYRKAKADCFFEKGFPTAVKFAEYEKDLMRKLENLLELLKRKNKNGKKGVKFNSSTILLNSCRLIPKKLSITPKKNIKNSHIHFSNPERAFEYLQRSNDLEPEFRIVGDFSVDIHIISALWINMVGHKFDACLDDKKVYAARLKRVRNEEELDQKESKLFHITAIGSFPHYSKNYQKWRNNGLKAIRTELEQNRPVIAVSLDLKSYYHLIDPSFIVSDEFLKEIGLELTDVEKDFTAQLSKLLVKWSEKAEKFAERLQGEDEKNVKGGLAIGLTASRIISNVLLYKWDKLIQGRLTPVHYGRYVDDMFLVLHDPKNITDTSSFMSFLQNRLRGELDENVLTKGENDIWEIKLGDSYQEKSKIQLQASKQKLFILDGQAGCDLLDSIENEIRDLSSEYRLMPEPDQLELSTAARVLSAAGNIGEEADTLRHADGLTIRRLSWALQLRNVETLAHDLPAYTWKAKRDEFYAFTYNHVLRAEKIFDQYPYLPRLLGLAVSLKDWHQAETIVRKSFEAFDFLAKADKEKIVINGSNCNIYDNSVWESVKYSLALAFIDAVIRYYPVDFLRTNEPSKKLSSLAKILSEILERETTIQDFHEKALLLAWSDLAKTPYNRLFKKLFYSKSVEDYEIKIENQNKVAEAFQDIELLNYKYLKSFLKASKYIPRIKGNKNKNDLNDFRPITPFLFPTRPYSPEEITALVPSKCIFGKKPLQRLARYMQVLRGVSINQALLNNEAENKKDISTTNPQLPFVTIGTKKSRKILIAITNLKTSYESWEASACNKSNLSVERYQQLSELINQAIKLKPRPDYLLLPELSLPLEWIDSVSNTLQRCGINVIAGTEYRHIGKNTIYSEACLILRDERLGYPSTVRIWQPKLQPAVKEDYDLISKYGRNWKDFSKNGKEKPVYSHNGFCFGIMVCSELLNSKARIAFQGEVDALLVLAWNQDLDTFSALIESTALDVHAYTVLVNNREYGDSRVRSPAKESFKRDLARLRGGENDYCVTVELDIEKLRAFQSRAKRWTEDCDPFKPVSEGFKISEKRKHLPPK